MAPDPIAARYAALILDELRPARRAGALAILRDLYALAYERGTAAPRHRPGAVGITGRRGAAAPVTGDGHGVPHGHRSAGTS